MTRYCGSFHIVFTFCILVQVLAWSTAILCVSKNPSNSSSPLFGCRVAGIDQFYDIVCLIHTGLFVLYIFQVRLCTWLTIRAWKIDQDTTLEEIENYFSVTGIVIKIWIGMSMLIVIMLGSFYALRCRCIPWMYLLSDALLFCLYASDCIGRCWKEVQHGWMTKYAISQLIIMNPV